MSHAEQHQRDEPGHFSPEAKQNRPPPEGVYPHNIHHHLSIALGTFIFKRSLSSTLKTTLKRINAGESPAAQQGNRQLLYTTVQNAGAKPQPRFLSWWRGPGTGHPTEARTWIFLHSCSQVTLILQTEAQYEPDNPDKAPLYAKGKDRGDGNRGPGCPAA